MISSQKILVQKFGGTSLGNAERLLNVARIIKSSATEHKIIAVVSAISSSHKKQGVTSLLLEVMKRTLAKESYSSLLEDIKQKHIEILEYSLKDEKLATQAKGKILEELEEVENFLKAIRVLGELSESSSDRIISTGERLSAITLSYILQQLEVDAVNISLHDVIQKGQVQQVDYKFNKLLKSNIAYKLASYSNSVLVVTGFVGSVPGGILKSIGRGYTDFTAATIAACLDSKELQIWKEVSGIYTADPSKVKNARLINAITSEEAAELSYYGSQVIHPYTIEQVVSANIPVQVKNSFHPDFTGTVISHKTTKSTAVNPITQATAVTVKSDVQIINIKSNRMLMAHGFMATVFNIFEKYQVIIDLIATSEVSVSVTTDCGANIMNAILDLKKIAEVEVIKNMAILSLIGVGMNKAIGTSAQLFKALADCEINVEMISQGASEINISCVIQHKDQIKALQAVHDSMVV